MPSAGFTGTFDRAPHQFCRLLDRLSDHLAFHCPQGGCRVSPEGYAHLTERLLRSHTLDCALPAAPLALEPDIETRRELYLFCKEVLHNISRHARATRVRFHLTPTAEGLRIEITDNGDGFDSTQAASGHGLSNLRERATVMAASLQILSTPGTGTSITLDLPRSHRWRKPDD